MTWVGNTATARVLGNNGVEEVFRNVIDIDDGEQFTVLQFEDGNETWIATRLVNRIDVVADDEDGEDLPDG